MDLVHLTIESGHQEGHLPGQKGGAGREGWCVSKLRPELHAVPAGAFLGWMRCDPPCPSCLTAWRPPPRSPCDFSRGFPCRVWLTSTAPISIPLDQERRGQLPVLCLCPRTCAVTKRQAAPHTAAREQSGGPAGGAGGGLSSSAPDLLLISCRQHLVQHTLFPEVLSCPAQAPLGVSGLSPAQSPILFTFVYSRL